MQSRERYGQSGQVLVQVALMLVVLLGFLALAIDVGNLYAQRRFMQNAADAGALAGAREICFGDRNQAEAQARYYATQVNRALLADPDVQGYTVAVTATTTVNTFVARVIGVDNVRVSAYAKAACGAADRGVGGIWPLTMNENDWGDIPCDGIFTLFTTQNENQNQQLDCNPCDGTDPDCVIPEDACDCSKVIAGGNSAAQLCIPDPIAAAQLTGNGAPMRIGPGERAWMNLFVPEPPYPLPPQNCGYGSCGAASVACWAEVLHPGPISICDQIRTQSGVAWSNGIRDAACMHANQRNELNVPLWRSDWSDVCPAGLNPELGCGSQTAYPITNFGCVQILGFSAKAWMPYADGTGVCKKNLTVIYAKRLCDGCTTNQGGTSGAPPTSGVRAVSLVE